MSDSSHGREDAFGSPPAAEMYRFYFDTNDGETLVHDGQGLELDGLEAARVQAQSALADMARDAVLLNGDNRTMSIQVRDEGGEIVLQATLTLVVTSKRS